MIFEGTNEDYAEVISHYVEIPLLLTGGDTELILEQTITAYVDRRVALFVHSGNMVRGTKTPKQSQQKYKAEIRLSITEGVKDRLRELIALKKLDLIL